ncbi:hypothetical protein SVAN01_05107 [Stagonosporopsis vannaccii]|nr:hypothetical protein SVAN01_05107 [Stagonosporopsis vannaccii]
MILCFGRNPSTEDYARFVGAMPGASYNGVKIRCSKMRMEMKKRYEELGWTVPEMTQTKSESKGKAGEVSKAGRAAKAGRAQARETVESTKAEGAKSRKRKAGQVDEHAGAEAMGGGVKKTRVKREEGEKGVEQEQVGEEGEGGDDGGAGGEGEGGVGVKEEEIDAE